jgi:hypothetical protein
MADTLAGRPEQIIAGKNHAHLAIPRRDGTVQTVIVWAHPEDGKITVNSAEGRGWPANLRRAGTATVTVMADGDPHEWVSVTGRLAGGGHARRRTRAHQHAGEEVHRRRRVPVPGDRASSGSSSCSRRSGCTTTRRS